TIIILILLVSCNNSPVFTKGQYIKKFEGFIITAENNYMTYDNDMWKKANTQFRDLSETEYSRFEKELSVDEKQKIDRLIGRYYSFVAKYQASQVKEKLKRLNNQAEGLIDNLSK
ncbi:MAG: DUF6565 domain-containing protein, partial [Deltaproteobacteria bacterium]